MYRTHSNVIVLVISLELPELREDVEGTTENANSTWMTVSFLKWKYSDTGSLPPTE